MDLMEGKKERGSRLFPLCGTIETKKLETLRKLMAGSLKYGNI